MIIGSKTTLVPLDGPLDGPLKASPNAPGPPYHQLFSAEVAERETSPCSLKAVRAASEKGRYEREMGGSAALQLAAVGALPQETIEKATVEH
jgi:hypothetical protein